MIALLAVAALMFSLAGLWLFVADYRRDNASDGCGAARARVAERDKSAMASTFIVVKAIPEDGVVTHAEVVRWLPDAIRSDFQPMAHA